MSELKKPKSRLGRGLSSLMSMADLPIEIDQNQLTAARSTAPASPAPSTPAAPPPQANAVSAPTVAQAAAPTGAPAEIPIDQIAANPHQPRRQFNDATLAELAASLKTNGLIQPVVVRRVGSTYQLVAGERRLRAAKLAGMTAIPAIIRDVDAFSQAQMALVENIQREDLNPLERASAYRALISQLGLTQSELASRIGEDRSSVANFLRLLELSEPVKNLIRDRQLSLGHAKVLAGVADMLEQERLAKLAVSQDLSVRNLERLVQSPATPPTVKPKQDLSAHLQGLEKSFARQLGMRVEIRNSSGKNKGRLIIHYASLDQFDALQERLGVSGNAD